MAVQKLEYITVHSLKILPQYFDAIVSGLKTFEIRSTNDRTFREGDRVILKEWDGRNYTGYQITKTIGYVTSFEQKPGFVVFSLK